MSLSIEQLQKLKQRLRARHKELKSTIHEELVRSDEEHYQDLAGQVHDTGEASVADALVDVDLAMIDHHISELREVEAAIKRVDVGGYGVCHECGDDIAFARLESQPAAVRCVACQERVELTQGRVATM